ncbi:MAG TPA: hypothetical protein VNL36_00305 [Bacteroidota bacterium]|nr:hypothetical protein [Bacteroidota bacterium]
MRSPCILPLLTVPLFFLPALREDIREVKDNAVFAQSQRDLGGRDHPLFPRLPGYRITSYERKDRATAHLHNIIEGGRHKGRFKVEGQLRVTDFFYEVESTTAKNGEEIKQHYRAIVKKLGGNIIYDKGADFTAKIMRKAGEGGTADITWLYVHAYTDAGPEYYVTIVEQKGDR